ncbi:MAG: hypothetical protein ACRELX_16210, partial [Longimicrobiales bacterium]
MYVRDLVVGGRLPDIRQFSRTYSFFSYPVGAELHRYLSDRFGDEYVVRMYEEYRLYDSFEAALEGILGVDLDRLSEEWRYALEKRFFPRYAERPPLDVGTRPIVTEGSANFKPVIYAPPGDSTAQLLFLSPRSGYTNLYLAPLDEGDQAETVLEGERSPEFESFHAFESGFDVSADGIVVLASKFMEHDALILWSLADREVVGRYQWDDLVGLRSPAWAPDGRQVVFEGLNTAGLSDLYRFDFDAQRRTALTADVYRDRDPDWSADGATIAFASDRTRFGADGYTNLFALDVERGTIRPLTSGRWNDQHPRWSHDGSRLAFSSDREGVFDLYAIDAHGNGSRLTALTGGAFDPEWLPGDTGLVFAGYHEGTFRIYRQDFGPDTA